MTLQASASKSDLILQCARPFEEGVETNDEPGEAALYGSAFHELMYLGKNLKADHLLPIAIKLERKWSVPGAADELVGHVRAAKKHLAEWLKGENPWGTVFNAKGLEHLKEQAFAINPSTLTCRRIDAPSVEDHVYRDVDARVEIPGTVDLMVLGGAAPMVMDYKTGRDPFDFLTVPEDVTQLRTLALAAWFEAQRLPTEARKDADNPANWGPNNVSEVILAVLHAPRGSVPAIYADLVPVEDLQRHAERLSDALKRKGDGSMRAGPCCRLCPARVDCPTQTGAYLAGAAQALELAQPTGNVMAEIVEYGRESSEGLATAEDVGRLHYFRAQFQKLAESAGGLMKRWVIDHPNDVAIRPDGKLLIIRQKTQENLSKASIIRALGKVAGEKLITELRENGVIETQEREELHAVDDK
jgi:hypothetical protein